MIFQQKALSYRFITLSLLFLLFSFSSASALASSAPDYNSAKKCAANVVFYEKKYSIPKNLLYAISLAETMKYVKRYKGGVAWPWTFHTNGKSFYFLNYEDALAFLKKNLRNGNSNIDVGCMQVNWLYHKDAFKRRPEVILNPETNIKWTAMTLRKHFNKTKSWRKAVALHHSRRKDAGRKYSKKVYAIWAKIKMRRHKRHAYNI